MKEHLTQKVVQEKRSMANVQIQPAGHRCRQTRNCSQESRDLCILSGATRPARGVSLMLAGI